MTEVDNRPFPVPMGVLSVWQRSTRDDPLVNMGKDDDLPDKAEVVIIGSGLCGAVTALSLLTAEHPPKSVVVLEAREASSGASGRNAGHCRPDAYRGYTAFSRKHSEQDAMEILQSERTVYELVDAFVKKHNVECEWTPRPTYDVCLSEEFKAYSNIAYDNVLKRGGAKEVAVHVEEASSATRVVDAVKAFEWPAATLNPAKLCYAVHHLCLQKGGYSIFTHTPALSVTASTDFEGSWIVNTPRGSIRSRKIVHATNAYASAILPEMEGLITPTKAQALKLSIPPVGLETFPRLDASYSLRYLPEHFYSVTGMPKALHESLINNVDDSSPVDEITVNAFSTFSKLFPQAGYDPAGMKPGQLRDKDVTADCSQADQKGFEYAWSGIIGVARIFLCAPALARIVMGEPFEATEIPKAFAITDQRLKKLKNMLPQAPAATPRVEKSTEITLGELQEPLAEVRLPSLTAEAEQRRVAVTA
ncbi:hypothetical protein QFC21_003438 [Naganishia friedmannii]|uniref:Uncharacterized protein n=1 Tax=Naganishia friedmannii TaxID=89922 RepID=A0ACC2VQC4_9TREE|nr:hypothetical protein QFC21_003438 [Naganishia friedmannii]